MTMRMERTPTATPSRTMSGMEGIFQAYEIQIEAEAGFSEAIWCNIESHGSKIIVGVVYRCPSISKDEDTSLHKVITHASRGECLIMGDFNHPDTKIFRRVQTRQECRTLQDDLNRLDQWSAKWQMLFNQSKCKCLHIGRANGKEPYEMQNTVLQKTSKEKDLGVTISADWKVSEQCGIAARKGNQLLGMIKRNITYREKNLIIPLYKSIVRPHLE